MSSYFSSFKSSNAISNLSTRFTTLRRAISSGEEVDDPENEDLSHVSNVLRAYYIEKGRCLPPWLPPDKKSSAATAPALVTQASLQGYGGDAPLTPTAGRGGGLGDLWGDSAAQLGGAQPQTSSLRLVRTATPSQQQQQQQQQRGPASSLKPPPGPPPPLHQTKSSNAIMESSNNARPLPSQRMGSYQTSQAGSGGALTPDRAISGASAQERLRARLHRGGGSSDGGGGNGRRPVGGYGR